MKPAFTFTHYSYDPAVLDPFTLMQRMNALGFIKSAEHHTESHAFWNQNAVLMMTSVNNSGFCGLRGMGFTMPTAAINGHPINFVFDPLTDTYGTTDPLGNTITLLPEELDISVYHFNVDMDVALQNDGCGLKSATGVIYNAEIQHLASFYSALDFRVSSVNKQSLIVNDNRVEIATQAPYTDRMRALVCDTDDVFRTTSILAANDVDFMDFDLSGVELDLAEANHKVRGYNCMATGDVDSWCIENFVPEALPNMDLIVRTRRKYKQISPQALEVYYGNDT